jgi:hypothetical protein
VRFNPSSVFIPNGPDDEDDWGDTRHSQLGTAAKTLTG